MSSTTTTVCDCCHRLIEPKRRHFRVAVYEGDRAITRDGQMLDLCLGCWTERVQPVVEGKVFA